MSDEPFFYLDLADGKLTDLRIKSSSGNKVYTHSFTPDAVSVEPVTIELKYGDETRQLYEDMIARYADPIAGPFTMEFVGPDQFRVRKRLRFLLKRPVIREWALDHGIVRYLPPRNASITVPKVVWTPGS